MELRRLTSTPNQADVYRLLSSGSGLDEISAQVGVEVHIDAALSKANKWANSGNPTTGSEADLAPEVHQALNGLSNRLLNDPGLWGWLALGPLSKFALYRWVNRGQLPATPEDMTGPQVRRFVTRPTLNGFARHAVARIYWGAATLYTDDRGYTLAEVVLGNQDFYQNVFERLLGLYRPAARACAQVLYDATEEERRQTIVELNLVFSTVAAELLSDRELYELVGELYEGVKQR